MIRFLLARSKWMLILSLVVGLCAGFGGVGLIAVLNAALGKDPDSMASLGLIFAGLAAFLLIARGASAFLLRYLSQNVIFDLRLQLSRRVLAAPFPLLQELGAAKILACLNQDVTTLAEAFQWLPMFCTNLAVVVGCIAYIGWLSAPLALIVGLIIVVGICCVRLLHRLAARDLKKARECDDALSGHFQGLTQGIKELKLHHRRRNAFFSDCLETVAAQYRQHYISGIRYNIFALNWGNGLFYVLIGAVLFILPLYHETSAEVLRGYTLAILYIMSPVTALIETLPTFNRASVALRKIEALRTQSDKAETNSAILPILFPKPAILEMIGVIHRYHGDQEDNCFTLGPLDLTVLPGELIFLIGGNGSGKTTLSLLLVGLYTPEQGEIRLGGRRITQANRESYRQQFSAVFSDFYLFDSLLGFEGSEWDAEARTFLAKMQLEHKVQINDGVFSSIDLSQGQRKRLALLVAYLENRPFYVFDEWAADQDPIFKKIFYTEILPSLKAKGKTVIVITHDDGYFHVADRCLKLNEGQLIEIPAVKQEHEIDKDNQSKQTNMEILP